MINHTRPAAPPPGRAAVYQFTLRDKITSVFQALRLRFLPRRILVAGPFVGEFGHELMDWQAWVRAQVGRYEEVHVITYPGRDYLYPGCKVHYHKVALETAGYKHGRFSPAELETMARAQATVLGLKDFDLLTPLHVCTRYHRRFLLPAKFELLGKPPVVPDTFHDVAFHFRNVKKDGPDQGRNYPLAQCDQVAAACQQRGLNVFCVGHPRYSYCPEGVEDRRSEDLAISVKALSSARLLVGELSGPMHLAQLSGIPILIWADGQWRLDNCEHWNVFHVPIYIVANDTHRPAPDLVVEKIVNALGDLRQRTQEFTRQPYTLPA